MRELKIYLPFTWYVTLANNKFEWKGDLEFLNLLIPALREVEDNDIIVFIIATSFKYRIWAARGNIQKHLDANDIAIVREYVVRRLRTIKEEEEAELKTRERLEILKKKIQQVPTADEIRGLKYDYIIRDDLLGGPATGVYPNSTSNQTGNITLKDVMNMMEQLKKKGF